MEKLPIIIYRFYTVYEDDPKNKGTIRARDMVEYGPIGQAGRTQICERIDILSRVNPNAGANPAMMAAKVLWEFIKPRYDAWKTNQDLPETGTPLAAWNHLTQAQAEILRVNGVRSVEDVAVLTDAHFTRFQIAGLRTITEAAKKFLESKDVNKVAGQMDTLVTENEILKQRIDELAQMVADNQKIEPEPVKRRPGRPPRQTEEAA